MRKDNRVFSNIVQFYFYILMITLTIRVFHQSIAQYQLINNTILQPALNSNLLFVSQNRIKCFKKKKSLKLTLLKGILSSLRLKYRRTDFVRTVESLPLPETKIIIEIERATKAFTCKVCFLANKLTGPLKV